MNYITRCAIVGSLSLQYESVATADACSETSRRAARSAARVTFFRRNSWMISEKTVSTPDPMKLLLGPCIGLYTPDTLLTVCCQEGWRIVPSTCQFPVGREHEGVLRCQTSL